MKTLFSSPERVRLLSFLLEEPGKEIKVRAIARKQGVSPAFVSKTVKILRKNRLLSNNRVSFLSPLSRALKIMLNVERMDKAGLIKKTKGLFPECAGIGMYGSWAHGLNGKDSDLDLWVKTEGRADDEKVIALRRHAKEKLGIEANVLVLTKEKIEKLKEKDFVFYCSLFNSFVLWGEQVD